MRVVLGGKIFCYGAGLDPPKRLGLICLWHMRTITMHAMPHGKAAMRAPCLAFAQLRIKQTHTPCAGVSMAGFDWQCSVCSFQCRAGAAKAWRLALSGEAHGGGGPRALQGKAWGYAGGSITRGRAGSSRAGAHMGTRGDGHGEGHAGWGEGHCGRHVRWMEMGDPVGRTKRERGAHRGRGPGKIVTAACCAPAQKTVQNQKLPVAGSERGLLLGRVNRYSNYATIAIVLSHWCFVLLSTTVFIASLRGHTRSSRAQSTVT